MRYCQSLMGNFLKFVWHTKMKISSYVGSCYHYPQKHLSFLWNWIPSKVVTTFQFLQNLTMLFNWNLWCGIYFKSPIEKYNHLHQYLNLCEWALGIPLFGFSNIEDHSIPMYPLKYIKCELCRTLMRNFLEHTKNLVTTHCKNNQDND